MRALILALAAFVCACAAGGRATVAGETPSRFPVARGTAPAPPTQASNNQSAPAEGRSAAGVDFGQWRSADPGVYAPAFQAQMRQRLAGRSWAQIQADLVANGFACETASRLDCRIEIMERQCAFDWYVVLERAEAEPVAGFEIMCLGAR